MDYKPYSVEIVGDGSVHRATPLRVSEGLRPRRVVLRKADSQWIVHYETMRPEMGQKTVAGIEYEVLRLVHEAYDQGSYFPFGAHNYHSDVRSREEAEREYERRVARGW